ncbi:hypothetical protein CLF_110911 [Clonorchis sinensis]|uniref:ZSWIM1/3 RNaseH-like domain-containing protein n=1 Tax=Clonorchis sinensis TaxID=79923 RepID=G7YU17_CLOSI|nr:hypothetical protein CLF_110911 [Clonorchis sinensis]
MASEVAAQAFAEKFGAVPFSSFTSFEGVLTQYMKENYVVFVLSSSNRSTNAVLRVLQMQQATSKAKEGRGIRRSYTRSTGYPVRFCLRRQRNHLAFTSYFLEHNHKLSKFLYERLPVNRRLTEVELGTCRALLKYGTPSCEVRQFVADEFGKILTTQDIYNYRQKCRPALLSRYKLYAFLITDGSGTGRPVTYAFVESEQFAPMRRLFGLFKEMMGEQYPVRTFVMDKLAAQMRAARVVFGCDVMLCCFHIRKAIKKHTHSANSRHIFYRMARLDNAVQFRQDLQLLRRTDPRFVSYLTARCLYITRKWAVHAQSGMVHFGNVTNNRLENANGRLKDPVHHADTLEHAIQKVSRHAEWLIREFEMHTSYHCDRRNVTSNRLENANGRLKDRVHHADTLDHAIQKVSRHAEWLMREFETHTLYHCGRRKILEDYGYVLNVVCRMTTYARSLVLRQLGPRPPTLPHNSVGTNKAHILQLVACRLWSRILHPNPDGGLGTQTWAFVCPVTDKLLPVTAGVQRIAYHITPTVMMVNLARCAVMLFGLVLKFRERLWVLSIVRTTIIFMLAILLSDSFQLSSQTLRTASWY